MNKSIAAASVTVALVAAGCGSSEETPTVVTQTVVTVVKRVVEKPQAEPVTKPKPKPAASKLIEVPNVVGENHQYAQDTMQAAGLYMLDERDATGQGRMLIWDRNWVVVEQDPSAGTMVDEDTTITLSSKKQGE